MTEHGNQRPQRGAAGTLRFWIIQAAVVVLMLTGVAWRVSAMRSATALPRLRNEPRSVGPLYDEPLAISDEQLRRVLRKLRPRQRNAETKINHVDHALRFWGAEAQFADASWMSGKEMRRLLVDHNRFREVYGAEADPLLIDTRRGVRVRTQQGRLSSSHYDHTLACLAEAGTPLDFPLRTPTRQLNMRAMLTQSLLDFRLNQVEYEWSALAYALYLDTPAAWTTTEGQRMTFDRVARRIIRQELPQGVCAAHHRMHALVMMLRIDEDAPLLSAAARSEVMGYLKSVTRKLVSSQHRDGYWTRDWPTFDAETALDPDNELHSLTARILATGHPLEWWALAPAELQPPREVVIRAAQWLYGTIDGLSDEQVTQYYTFLTHAGRALCLWRRRYPYQVALDGP